MKSIEIREHDIIFLRPANDGRNYWQDIVIGTTGVEIGALCQSSKGPLQEVEMRYQMRVKDTIENRKYKHYDTEDDGFIFVYFYTLKGFLNYYNNLIWCKETT